MKKSKYFNKIILKIKLLKNFKNYSYISLKNKKISFLLNKIKHKFLKLSKNYFSKDYSYPIKNLSEFKIINKASKAKKSIKTRINFLNKYELRELNPESFIIYLYIFLSLLFSLVIIFTLGTKLANKNKNLNNSIKELQSKKLKIPELKVILKNIEKKNSNLLQEDKLITNLIGGSKNLKTVLTIINNLAIKNSIEIVKFEPLSLVKFKDKKNTSISEVDKSAIRGQPKITQPNEDNNKNLLYDNNYLLNSDLEKQIVKLKIKGYFINILEFLREIEYLENLVIVDDFNIFRLSEINKSIKSKLEYETTLSIFGRVE